MGMIVRNGKYIETPLILIERYDKTIEREVNVKICGLLCQLNIYRRSYKTASRPTGGGGIVGHLDVCDSP